MGNDCMASGRGVTVVHVRFQASTAQEGIGPISVSYKFCIDSTLILISKPKYSDFVHS